MKRVMSIIVVLLIITLGMSGFAYTESGCGAGNPDCSSGAGVERYNHFYNVNNDCNEHSFCVKVETYQQMRKRCLACGYVAIESSILVEVRHMYYSPFPT